MEQRPAGCRPARPSFECHAADPGFTLIELLLVIAVIAIIAAIAVPGLMHARMAGNEASAIGSLRTINSAQATYASSCGGNGYAQWLEDLARAPQSSSTGFISPDLATNGASKSGYFVALAPDPGATDLLAAGGACNANTRSTVSAYFSDAHPQAVGMSGRFAYASDKRGAIYWNASGAPIAPGMAGANTLQ
jgi:type IV pilus assembly protein PilA